VATPQGFERNPNLVHDFYNLRRRGMASVDPNAAHFAPAELEREFHSDFLLVTQNVGTRAPCETVRARQVPNNPADD
jgi:NAD-dependent deacetylase